MPPLLGGADLGRNQWPIWIEIGGRFTLEWVAELGRNIHAGQKPEPGAYYGAVTVVLAPRTTLAEAADKAIEMTRPVIGQAQVDADILAEYVIENDVVVLAEKIDSVFIQAAQCFLAGHTVK